MIRFKCPKCLAEYEVEDELAGARVACSECDTHFYVPSLEPADDYPVVEGLVASDLKSSGKIDISSGFPASLNTAERKSGLQNDSASQEPSPKPKLSPRQRRLSSDLCMMQDYFTSFPLIHLERVQGNPPELYVVSYRVRGIECLRGEEVVYRDYHEVEIKLPGTYPRTPPICRMLTPIFHPNIEPAIICIGDHWTAAERLCDLVVRIGEMITYQAHNIKSPLDGEAAMWTDLHQDMLPVDARDLTPPEV